MTKTFHEIRDPIHNFIYLDSQERKVLDSKFFQRLRHIHQLGLTYLLYPSATHKRFEHSLGVMELASRVFDVVTNPSNITKEIKKDIFELKPKNKKGLKYWKNVLRMAALCHDIGHLPFSHSTEKIFLPVDQRHEDLTKRIIFSDEMKEIWKSQKLKSEDIMRIALGSKKIKDLTTWETILSEIITSDAFGVDRMDYLLRDSLHIGVAYGKFDHYRLIDTLRILPSPRYEVVRSKESSIGIEEGGIHAAEALLLARYFMYSQVYLHPIRQIYDIHLRDFLNKWMDGKKLSDNLDDFLFLTDNEVNTALRKAAFNENEKGHDSAKRIICHKHFKFIYQPSSKDIERNFKACEIIFDELKKKFGAENVRIAEENKENQEIDFPIKLKLKIEKEKIASSLSKSKIIEKIAKDIPALMAIDRIFIHPDLEKRANNWLKRYKDGILLR